MEQNNKINHLSMIQQVISRMGSNSFKLKGWSVGIMIAIYAFAGNNSHKAVVVTLIPLIVFCLLDSYYLMLERKFGIYIHNLKDFKGHSTKGSDPFIKVFGYSKYKCYDPQHLNFRQYY